LNEINTIESDQGVYMKDNKVIGLMCAFICHNIQISIDFLTCAHFMNMPLFAHNSSPQLVLYLF